MTNTTRLRFMFAAALITVLGSNFTTLALPWLVLTTTGSATRTAVVFAVEVAVAAIVGIPSGSLVERLGLRTAMLLAEGLCAPLLCLLPLLAHVGQLSFGAILALAGILGALGQVSVSAGMVAIAQLAGEVPELLTKANGQLSVVQSVGGLLGKALAGVAIAALGAINVLWLDAASYLGSFLLLLVGLPRAPRRRPRGAGVDPDGMPEAAIDTGGVLAGLTFLLRHPLIRPALPTLTLGNAAIQALMVAVPVAVAASGHSASWFGWTMAGFSVGTIVGGLAIGPLARRIASMRLVSAGLLGGTVALLLPVLLGTQPIVIMMAMLLFGVTGQLINSPALSLLMLETPVALRPKMMASLGTLTMIAMPLGALAAGPLLDRAAPWWTFLAVVVVSGACNLLLFLAWLPRTLRDTAPSAAPAAADDEGAAATAATP